MNMENDIFRLPRNNQIYNNVLNNKTTIIEINNRLSIRPDGKLRRCRIPLNTFSLRIMSRWEKCFESPHFTTLSRGIGICVYFGSHNLNLTPKMNGFWQYVLTANLKEILDSLLYEHLSIRWNSFPCYSTYIYMYMYI